MSIWKGGQTQTGKGADRHKETDRRTDRCTDKCTDRHTDRRTDRHTDRRTDRHTDRHRRTDAVAPAHCAANLRVGVQSVHVIAPHVEPELEALS